MARILVICTANICRSPVAAALLRDRLRQRGLNDWQVGSAGTWALNPRGASRYSVDVMQERGFDISDHRATMVEQEHLAESDLVLTMETGHAEALRVEFPEHAYKVFMLTEMVGESYNVDDPYGGPYDEYVHMADSITELIDEGLDQIVSLAQRNSDGLGQIG